MQKKTKISQDYVRQIIGLINSKSTEADWPRSLPASVKTIVESIRCDERAKIQAIVKGHLLRHPNGRVMSCDSPGLNREERQQQKNLLVILDEIEKMLVAPAGHFLVKVMQVPHAPPSEGLTNDIVLSFDTPEQEKTFQTYLRQLCTNSETQARKQVRLDLFNEYEKLFTKFRENSRQDLGESLMLALNSFRTILMEGI